MNWDDWKKDLRKAVKIGETLQISQEKMDSMAYRVGDFLAQRVDPMMPEQMVLKELWEVASQEEQRTLASLVVRLVD